MRAFRRFTGVALGLTFALIVLGAVVRVTGSGLACPDWPRCYGQWLPTTATLAAIHDAGYTFGQVVLEWLHRLLAGGIVGPLVVVLGIWAFRLRHQVRALAPLMALALVLVVAEAGLGGLTVLERNIPWSVAAHLTTALLLFAVLIAVFLFSERKSGFNAAPDRLSPRVRTAAIATLVVALATMASGAMMAASGASLACDGWPLCDGGRLPDLSDAFVRLHFGHRFLALATALLIAGLLIVGRAQRGTAPRFHRDVAAAAALAVLEVTLGAAVVVLAIPQWLAVVHQAVGILVFAALATAFTRSFARRPRFARA